MIYFKFPHYTSKIFDDLKKNNNTLSFYITSKQYNTTIINLNDTTNIHNNIKQNMYIKTYNDKYYCYYIIKFIKITIPKHINNNNLLQQLTNIKYYNKIFNKPYIIGNILQHPKSTNTTYKNIINFFDIFMNDIEILYNDTKIKNLHNIYINIKKYFKCHSEHTLLTDKNSSKSKFIHYNNTYNDGNIINIHLNNDNIEINNIDTIITYIISKYNKKLNGIYDKNNINKYINIKIKILKSIYYINYIISLCKKKYYKKYKFTYIKTEYDELIKYINTLHYINVILSNYCVLIHIILKYKIKHIKFNTFELDTNNYILNTYSYLIYFIKNSYFHDNLYLNNKEYIKNELYYGLENILQYYDKNNILQYFNNNNMSLNSTDIILPYNGHYYINHNNKKYIFDTFIFGYNPYITYEKNEIINKYVFMGGCDKNKSNHKCN